jgi:phosphoglycerate kinase
MLPLDHVVASELKAGVMSEVTERIGDQVMALDIGPRTVEAFSRTVAAAKTIIWNGPMGVFEVDPFGRGTMAIARAVAAVHGTTIVGGGDSMAAITKGGVADMMTHISTGGGASLEFLGGRKLPGVEALRP